MPNLTFTCPSCGHNELGSVESVIMTYPIRRIPDSGDLDYDYDNPEAGDSEVLFCGYELKDDAGNPIQDNMPVVEWMKKNVGRRTEE